jgi:hypothetical protein
MAETMTRRMRQPDVWLDDALESAPRRMRRTGLRAALLRARTEGVTREGLAGLASSLRVTPALVERALLARSFGAGWADLERVSPTLMRVPLRLMDLAHETALAMRVLHDIRAGQALKTREYPADNAMFAIADGSAVLAAPLE